MAAVNPKAYPLATPDLQPQLLKLVEAAAKTGQVKKGANEATKALNKGKAELIILAADAEPLEILLHLPLLCEDKNVPFVFVREKSTLGRTCGVSRPVIAVAILGREHGPLEKQILEARNQVESLPL
eukprot:Protomagalhaensia_wolfi_Nauph_80__3961@NODE_4012_length_659_cov_161_753226_g2594_i1_p1_GENE_NODE_4012_length_659_cov_161_753226_g2594_i1NODE_4012_length_659_cov_161_753226_g2594_i1_p1_ORF_typecomplete_len127_score34_64Ribosomal_L7Ae/PF01248_26/5_9e29PELOTA_1/PF15608_6/0_0028_NODE_4012_length_659_cov_161_753226_g2594_i165445